MCGLPKLSPTKGTFVSASKGSGSRRQTLHVLCIAVATQKNQLRLLHKTTGNEQSCRRLGFGAQLLLHSAETGAGRSPAPSLNARLLFKEGQYHRTVQHVTSLFVLPYTIVDYKLE